MDRRVASRIALLGVLASLVSAASAAAFTPPVL
jgi:hypothetical protein